MKGFNNLGNTCYLNSGLQMLMNNHDFCQAIINNRNKSIRIEKLARFIERYHQENTTQMSPKYIKKLIEKRKGIFMGFSQHDSAEFLIFFLDLLNEEIGDNKIDKLFEIRSNINIKCKMKSCLNISSHEEKNLFLILPINSETQTLDDCYRQYKEKVKFEGDNLYYCEKCNKKRIASKRIETNHWPNNLIIWIKRYEQISNKFKKEDKDLDIPLIWRHNYTLQGGVVHMGSLNGGHYIYYGKVLYKWYLFNDNSVSQLSNNNLERFLTNSYLLYYKIE